ncbi:NB-ARC domain-containing protein, partial [Aetokthonos hydrillicola]
MADIDEQILLILTEVAKKLKDEPQADLRELVAALKAVLAESSQLASAASRMNQINLDDAKGFQTVVEGGIAQIGFHYHFDIQTIDKLKAVLYTFITEQKHTPTGIPQNLPRISIAKFVGRHQELKILHQQLQIKDQVIICAIAGMGGVGKTELALQYAHYHWHQGTYLGGICWLQGREIEVGSKIVEFAITQLGLQPPDLQDLRAQVSYCWRCWQEGDVLLVVDDVKDFREVEPYLPPQSSRFKVLITTRLQFSELPNLTLDVLQEEDALDLLQQWIGKEKILEELVSAKKLCQRLGYLPLALQLAGRYVKKQKLSLITMLERLDQKGLRHRSLDQNNNDRTCTLNIKRGVAAAFEVSWDELTKEAKQLGCLLGLFALAPIPWSLVESVNTEQDTEDLEDARVNLEEWHFLQGDQTYHLHQLIREFFQQKLADLE